MGALVACGGSDGAGGGGGGTANLAPVAQAGSDATVDEGNAEFIQALEMFGQEFADFMARLLELAFDLSGTITVPDGTVSDTDVNDPNATFSSNDTPALAQSIPNPVTAGGYVNRPGSGEDGRSRESGDISDFYRVSLVAGQTITLSVAEPTVGNPDLYLWDDSGTFILDASLSVGPVETLTAPSNGDFLVEAYALSGASNYVLVIGLNQIAGVASGFRLSNDFVPGQAVIRYDQSATPNAPRLEEGNAIATLGLRELAGAPDRELLMELDVRTDLTEAFQALGIDSKMRDRAQFFSSAEQQRKWDTLMAITALNRQSSIAYAEPNYILQSLLVPNDEFYGLQWHYPLINLPAAWDLTIGDPNITVAVIDTGVLLGHPDMQGQLIPGYDFIRDAQNANDGDGIDPNPDDPGDSGGITSSVFHGTHVAGTIAARTNDASGVAGIAWNARIMPLRVLGQGGFGTFYDVRQAIRYAAGLSNDSGSTANPPVEVINLSLGGPGFSQFDQDVINQARSAGVVVVAAAGNDATSAPFYPAAYDGVISVSSVGLGRTLAGYSNTGPTIDVTAPGGDNRFDINGDGRPDEVYSASGNQTPGSIQFVYRFLQGTSMAAPHVAGVIALMKSVNANLTPSDIDILLANGDLTDDLGATGRDDLYGYGLINARKAVAAALEAIGTPPADNPMLDVTPPSINFGTAGTSIEVVLRNSGGGFLQLTGAFANPPAPWLSLISINVNPDGLGTYALVVNRSGLATDTYSTTVSFESNVNTVQVPVIMQVTTGSIAGDAGFTYVLLVDPVTFSTVRGVTGTPSGGALQYQFVDVEPGNYQIWAGTDADNDFFICDPGEACGAFATLDQPAEITVDGDLTGIDFPMSYSGAIPAQSQNSHLAPREGLRRLNQIDLVERQ